MLMLTNVYQNILNNMNANMLQIIGFLAGAAICTYVAHLGCNELLTYYREVEEGSAAPIPGKTNRGLALNWVMIVIASLGIISNFVSLICAIAGIF